MNSYCGHGGEIGVKEEEKEFFDTAKKEKIEEIVGALKDEEFVIEKEISHVIEEKK